MQGDPEAINTARKTLANNCILDGSKNPSAGSRSTDCDQVVGGGKTVVECSEDPYLTACRMGIAVAAFAEVRGTRDGICLGTGSNPFSSLCDSNPNLDADKNTACLRNGANAAFEGNDCLVRKVVQDACDENPYVRTSFTDEPLCLNGRSIGNGEDYSTAQSNCENPDITFTKMYCKPNDKDETPNNPTGVKTARNNACAARGTEADDSCDDRQNIIDTCTATDPFANKGCDTAAHILDNENLIRKTYCTTGNTNIFDSRCTDVVDGEVAKERARVCRLGTENYPAENAITQQCGEEQMAGGLHYDYCQSEAGLTDRTNCDATITAAEGDVCTTNPWGDTSPTSSTACDPTTYYATRLNLCNNVGAFPEGVIKSAVCAELARRTCKDGGEGADVNPFHAICFNTVVDYTPQRLARCEVDSVNDIVASGGSCSGAGLSDVICGMDASEAGSNPFAKICESDTQNDNYSGRVASRETFCGGGRLDAGATNKDNCDGIQDGLCTGATLVSDVGQGAGGFICLRDNGPNVVTARAVFCADPATTYTEGCTVTHSEGGNDVLATRKDLAVDCVKDGDKNNGTLHDDCKQIVSGTTTVATCSKNPYTTGNGCLTDNAFDTVRTNRMATCASSATPFNDLCNGYPQQNAEQVAYCDTPTTAWETRCKDDVTTDTGNAIANRRASVCINNEAIITTEGAGNEVDAGLSLFNDLCTGLPDTDKSITTARLPLCSGALDALTSAGGRPALCKDDILSGALCGTSGAAGSNPFAPICYETMALVDGFSEMDAKGARVGLATTCLTPNADADSIRLCALSLDGVNGTTTLADCSENPYLTTDDCHTDEAFMTVRENRETLCTTARDSFNNLCDFVDVTENVDNSTFGAIRIARGEACATDTINTTGESCGDEGTQGSYLAAYCGSSHSGIATNVRDCPNNYHTANNGDAGAVSLADNTTNNKPLNSKGSAGLDVIAVGGANDGADDPTNFIEVNADGTLLTTGTNRDGLTLTEDTADGFAFADNNNKLYVGLLATTNLGAPFRSDETDATWNAQLSVLFGATPDVLAADLTFKLRIRYGTGTDTPALSIVGDGPVVGSLGKFSIVDGKFTRNGVIYGSVSFATAGAGTLTGLIGTGGAVGIFASNSDATEAYVGGFIASETTAEVTVTDCSAATGNPFHADCPNNVGEQTILANTCIGAGSTGRGCDQPITGNDGDISVAVCSANPYGTTNGCVGNDAFADRRLARLTFCTEPDTLNAFDAKCNIETDSHADKTTFVNRARSVACGAGQMPTTGNCGDEDTADTYVYVYCSSPAGNADLKNCPSTYAGLNPAPALASVAELGSGLLNSDGSGLATVIAEGAGNTATETANFITGGVAALDTGLTQTNDTAFRLNALDNSANPADAISGFAVAIAEQKYYVGLLSGTTLGTLLPNADVTTTLEWGAKLRVLRDTTFEAEQDFTLLVELNAKTISVKTGSITADTRQFTINDGKFTANGLLYGTISFAKSASDSTYDGTAEGSLTGLIGRSGAVGIFKSDVDSASDYVGGFVAHTNVDCTATGTPFDISCADGNPGKLPLCGGPVADLLSAGHSLADCKHADLSGEICGIGSGDLGSNHFAPICYEAAALHETTLMQAETKRNVTLTCSTLESSVSCGLSLTGKPGGTTVFACYNNPFLIATECLTNTAFDATRSTRRNLCTTEGDTFNPFDTKCDAATATDATYLSNVETARDTFCASDKATSGHAECDTTGRTAKICTDTPTLATKPFATLCGGNDGVTNTLAQAAACRISSDADNNNCTNTIMAFCGTMSDPTMTAANLFDTVLCTGDFENARNNYCLNTNTEGDALCKNGAVDYTTTICAVDSTDVFAKVCTDDQRQAFCTTGTTNIFNTGCGELDGTAEKVVGTTAARKTACVNNDQVNGGTNDCTPNGAGFTAWAGSASPLDAGSAGSGDGDTNFIRGELDSNGKLNLGAENTLNDATFTVNDDGVNGFAIGQLTTSSGAKLYAGLLSTTAGVGAPYNTNVMGVTWSGKLAYILRASLTKVETFVLTVNFDGSSGSIEGTVGTELAGKLTLTGNFTGTGNNLITDGKVAYKRTEAGLELELDNAGTLTGLIGEKGAIGVFRSTHAEDNAHNFVGGFAVNKPAPVVINCTAMGENRAPFHATCTGTANDALRLQLCINKDPLATGDLVGNCKTDMKITDKVCATSGTNANPFDIICVKDYVPTIEQIQQVFADFCDAGDSVSLNEATCSAQVNACIANPFHTDGVGCDANVYANVRDGYCRTAPFGHADCGSGGYTATICAAGDSPFATHCGPDNGLANAEERGKACFAGNTGGSNKCGNERGGYLRAYCRSSDGMTNAAVCPLNYAAANDTAVTEVSVEAFEASGENKALNADGTGLERVVEDEGANLATDDRTNFIEGRAGGLELSSSIAETRYSAFRSRNDRDTGFAFARATNASNQNYYYVGLLSGTNLGAPLPTATATTYLEWSGQLRTLIATTALPTQDFTLLVELSAQTIHVRSGSITNGLRFTINGGKFTDNGLLYGRIVYGGNAGTLTGLIGGKGAVGIFKGTSGTPYVGGFVAEAPRDCTATGTPFHADCTYNHDLQAELCRDNHVTPVTAVGANYDTDCVGNTIVTSRICTHYGDYANVFNRVICPGGDNYIKRVNACIYHDSANFSYGQAAPAGFDVTTDCADDPKITAQVCRVNGTHTKPFDLNICPDSNESWIAVRAAICGNNDIRPVTNFNSRCSNNQAVTNLVCGTESAPGTNPFDRTICLDSKASNNMARAAVCRAWATDGLPSGVSVRDDCADDMAITNLICADNGDLANPFDSTICTSDETITIGEGDEAKTVLVIKTIQSAFIANCRADTAGENADCSRYDACVTYPYGANCSATDYAPERQTYAAFVNSCRDNTAEPEVDCSVYTTCAAYPYGAECDATNYVTERQTYANLIDSCRDNTAEPEVDCSVYTTCAENPYQATCDAENYHVERANYANQFVEACLGIMKMDIPVAKPVGAPASCVDELAQATICSSSGKYANPFNTEICPDGYKDLATIQSQFATMCYNTRADLRKNPECENIATCFASDKLGIASATSTTGGIACDSAAFNDAVTSRDTLASCDTQVSGATLIDGCLQPTVTEACNANPFSEVVAGKGIDCLSDTALNDRREAVCINDNTKPAFDCPTTTTRVCGIPAIISSTGEVTTDGTAGSNSFSDLCYDNDGFAPIRYAACNAISTQITPTARTNDDTTIQNCINTIDYECQFFDADLFTNDFCKIGTLYNMARGQLCLAGYAGEGSDECGDEDGMGGTYVKIYCDAVGLTNLADCPKTYARLNPVANGDKVDVAILTAKALNAEGTALLPSFIAEDNANETTDADSNFIVGGESDLSLGASAGTPTETPDDRNLTLVGDDTSGFAVASAGGNYYVGLLSGTDLGAPLATEQTAGWAGQLSITTSEGGGVYPISLNINFDKKNLNFSKDALGLTDALTKFAISGKFTANGVIYGTVLFEDANTTGRDDNEGTLTGLIGASGAVGIFASNADADTTYVGGFIAAPEDCSSTGKPFDASCGGTIAKLPLCSGALDALMTAGGTPALCNDVALSGAICGMLDNSTPIAGTNPFAPICDDSTAWVAGFTEANLNTIRNPLAANCGSSANEATTPCIQSITGVAGETTVAACSKNPFLTTHDCHRHNGFIAERMTLETLCTEPSDSFDGKCDIESAPLTDATFAGKTQIARGQACVTDTINTDGKNCGDDSMTSSYVYAYCTDASTAAMNNARDCGNTAYADANSASGPVVATGFTGKILNAEGTAKLAGVITAGNSADTDSTANFIEGGADALALNGTPDANHAYSLTANDDGISGFAIASTTFTSGEQLYVGLLANTNLGGSLTATMNWPAKLRVLRNGQDLAELQTFILRADFTNKTISADIARQTGTKFEINGHFATNGLIYGNLIFNTASGGDTEFLSVNQATLTGLIGAQGAVGIFSRDAEDKSFVGGFVATTPTPNNNDLDTMRVDDNDWKRSFDWNKANTGQTLLADSAVPLQNDVSASGTNRADYIQGTATGIDGIYSTESSMNLEILSLPNGNGAAFGVVGTGSDTALHFAGLLSNTNVGAPLAEVGTATWTGKIGGFINGESVANNSDFHISVFFNGAGGIIKSSNSAGSSQINDGNVSLASRFFKFTGSFGASGVLTGTVKSSTVGNFLINNQDGTFNGIIGQDGLLAVFKSNVYNTNGGAQYAGAFAAVPSGSLPTLETLVITAPVIITEDDDAMLVSYVDWVLAQDNPSRTANTDDPKNEFLAILKETTVLNEAGIATTASTRRLSIDLTSIGRTVDGIGGFAALANGELSYAGILPNTNLGKPLTSGGVSAKWRGGFHAVGGYQIDQIGTDTNINGPFARPSDFELDITFGGVSGMVGSIKGSLEISPSGVNLARADVYFLVEGNFNASGVITGTVNFGKFDDGNLDTPADGRAPNGVLTGLIGENGAVGAFISNPVDTSVTTGDRNFVYAGGFAVAPQEEETITPEVPLSYTYGTDMATYSDWVDSFDTGGDNASDTNPLRDSGVITNPNFNFQGNYIKLDKNDKIVINTNTILTTTPFRLNENSGEDGYESGFAYGIYNDGFEAEAYAGLLSSTDVGGVITSATTKATWSGRLKGVAFNISGASKALTSDNFELEVAFTNNGGTITTLNNLAAALDNSEFLTVSGSFNTAGVISGDVALGGGANNGVLSGLIGAIGAVAAFNGETNAGGFAGGFVVANPVYVPAGTANYADFKTHYAEQTGDRQLLALADSSGNSSTRGFLQGTATGLIETGITVDAGVVSDFSSQAIRLGKAQDGADGFAVLASRQGRYAGLLSETDLGAPLPIEAATTVEWMGSLHYANSSTSNRALSESPDTLVLTVDVNDGTLTSNRVRVPLGQNSNVTSRTIEINGTFGNHADGLRVGVLGGTISLYNDATKEKDGDLIGLIGEKGVLGVFHTSGFIGGFEAASLGNLPTGMKPEEEEEVASTTPNFVAWQQAFNAGKAGAVANGDNLVLPADGGTTSFAKNGTYFIEGGESAFELAGITGGFTDNNILRLSDDSGNDDFNSGVIFWQGAIDGNTGVGVAGLLSGTDLGAPLDSNFVSAVWSGKLRTYAYAAFNNAVDFHLKVAYTNNGGTVRSITAASGGVEGAVPIDGFGQYGSTIDINGSFNNIGVMSGTADLDSGTATGTFIGLIGAKGAVGAFKDNGTTAEFIGGFVVKPSN